MLSISNVYLKFKRPKQIVSKIQAPLFIMSNFNKTVQKCDKYFKQPLWMLNNTFAFGHNTLHKIWNLNVKQL